MTVDPAPPTDSPPQGGWPLGTIVRSAVVLALFAGLAIALGGGWERLREYEWQLEPWAVGLALLTMVVAAIVAAVCWLAVARAFGAPLATLPALRIYSTSNLGKYLPGKVLHAFARVYFAQQHGLSLSMATTTVVIDVVLYVAAGLLLVVVALPTVANRLAELDGRLVSALALAGVVVGLAALHPAVLNRVFILARRIMPTRTFPTIDVGYGTILKIFVLYIVVWMLNGLGLFFSVRAVYPEFASAGALPVLWGAYALSYLSGLLMPLAPAGLGVREALMALLLAQLVPWPAATAASVLVRVVQVVAEGLCAAAFSRAA
jgi:uncharacterized membrane protein YbhN (UPF0104 family)